LAIVQSFVPNVGTAWEHTTQELARYYDRVLARPASEAPPPPPPAGSPLALIAVEPPLGVAEMIGSYRDTAVQLGRRVAELHLALASNEAPDFAPEPYSVLLLRSKYQGMRTLTGRVLRLLRERLSALPKPARADAERLLAREPDVLRWFEPLLKVKIDATRIRIHGNLHLGHVLYTGKTFVMTDFDGMKEMSLAERRRKRTPLVDVTSLVRSFDFAALKVLCDPARVREADFAEATPWAHHWATWVSAAYLRAYLEVVSGSPIVPSDRAHVAVLFDAFAMQRELHRLRELLEDHSEAVSVSLLGLLRMLG
jgi:maltose alpha-D-glucosyltransferase/alpha-amylase